MNHRRRQTVNFDVVTCRCAYKRNVGVCNLTIILNTVRTKTSLASVSFCTSPVRFRFAKSNVRQQRCISHRGLRIIQARTKHQTQIITTPYLNVSLLIYKHLDRRWLGKLTSIGRQIPSAMLSYNSSSSMQHQSLLTLLSPVHFNRLLS